MPSTTRHPPVKLLEGLVLLAVVVLFAWWQLRDVSKAQAERAQKRTEKRAEKPEATQAAANEDTKDTL